MSRVLELRPQHDYRMATELETRWLEAAMRLLDMGMPIVHECPPGLEGECVVCRAGAKVQRAYNIIEEACNDVERVGRI